MAESDYTDLAERCEEATQEMASTDPSVSSYGEGYARSLAPQLVDTFPVVLRERDEARALLLGVVLAWDEHDEDALFDAVAAARAALNLPGDAT